MTTEVTISPVISEAKTLIANSKRLSYPRSYIVRTAEQAKQLKKEDQRDPYDQSMKDRFEDTYRSDGLVKRSIDKLVLAVVGKHGQTILDCTTEYPDTEQGNIEKNNELQSINNNAVYKDAKQRIDRMHSQLAIDFHNKISSAVKQCFVYGRAAIEIIKDGDGAPVALHLLNSKKLGRVKINEKTWMMEGVEYTDLPTNNNLLRSEDLIYFAINDDNISPGSTYYGLSMLEPLIDGSETKRIIKQEDLKEAAKTSWQGIGLVRFLNENATSTEIQNFMQSIRPGTWTGYKHEVDIKVETLKAEFQQLTQVVDFINRETLRDLGVPSFIAGYEQTTNYSNATTVVASFKSIDVDHIRLWLKNIIQQQWLSKIFYPLINQPNPNSIDYDPTTMPYPEVQLNYEFEDLVLDTTTDKVNANLPLFDRDLISGESLLRAIGKDAEIEGYSMRKEQKSAERARQFDLQVNKEKEKEEEDEYTFPPMQMKTASTKKNTKEIADIYSLLKKKIKDL